MAYIKTIPYTINFLFEWLPTFLLLKNYIFAEQSNLGEVLLYKDKYSWVAVTPLVIFTYK